jgi:hypothetical protein
MRTIDKQDIARTELREKLKFHVFRSFLDQGMQPGKAPFEKFLRKRFDTDESRAAVFRGRFAQTREEKPPPISMINRG